MHAARRLGPRCDHVDGTQVFDAARDEGALRFFAGSYRGAHARRYDLVLDLADMLCPLAEGYGLRGPLEAWVRSREPAAGVLKLRWEDRQVPSLERRDWLELARSLLEGPYERVYVCCYGGHGRTGTCLAILACMLTELGHPIVPEGLDPIAWLRARYCSEAVESRMQVEYISYVTGRPEAMQSMPPVMVYRADAFPDWDDPDEELFDGGGRKT